MKTRYLEQEKADEERHGETMTIWRKVITKDLTEENNQMRERIAELETTIALHEPGSWNTVSSETIECLSYAYKIDVCSNGGGFVLKTAEDSVIASFVFPDNIRLRKIVEVVT